MEKISNESSRSYLDSLLKHTHESLIWVWQVVNGSCSCNCRREILSILYIIIL
ncbi:hypothetical protein CAL7102_09980 [Dulcicalothrix desertica PCC 7102]|nr:hypothetical protein CAL7102_09980 [Dulcicalothrix desertica PCC 7102]